MTDRLGEGMRAARLRIGAPEGTARGGSLALRAGLLTIGCALASLCYALTIRAGLGLGPLFAVQDGVAVHLGISIGTSVMVVGVFFLVLAVVLRGGPGPGTVALPFLAGGFLDLFLPWLPVIHGLGLRLIVVVMATWFMGLGGSLVIKGALGPAAYDAVMMGIHRRIGRPVAVVRLAMEASMLVLGWLLGGAIGVGTVITGVLIGPSMHVWLHLLGVTRHGTPDPVTGSRSPGSEPADQVPPTPAQAGRSRRNAGMSDEVGKRWLLLPASRPGRPR